MADAEVKPWKCPSGHTLGHVVRTQGVRRLLLYRRADERGDVIAELTGNALVLCEICFRTRVWDVGAEGMRELLERRFGERPLDSAEGPVLP